MISVGAKSNPNNGEIDLSLSGKSDQNGEADLFGNIFISMNIKEDEKNFNKNSQVETIEHEVASINMENKGLDLFLPLDTEENKNNLNFSDNVNPHIKDDVSLELNELYKPNSKHNILLNVSSKKEVFEIESSKFKDKIIDSDLDLINQNVNKEKSNLSANINNDKEGEFFNKNSKSVINKKEIKINVSKKQFPNQNQDNINLNERNISLKNIDPKLKESIVKIKENIVKIKENIEKSELETVEKHNNIQKNSKDFISIPKVVIDDKLKLQTRFKHDNSEFINFNNSNKISTSASDTPQQQNSNGSFAKSSNLSSINTINEINDMLDLADERWTENLVNKLNKAKSEKINELELSLSPKKLGKMKLLINIQDDKASVTIKTENISASIIINEQENKLNQMFEEYGMRLANFHSENFNEQNNNDEKNHNHKTDLSNENEKEQNNNPKFNDTSEETLLNIRV